MNLTRGEGGKCPCPICYVPKNEQQDLDKTHELRTTKGTQAIYNMAMAAPTRKAREAILKPKGIRMIKVYVLLFLAGFSVLNINFRMRFGRFNFLILMLQRRSTICTITLMARVANIFCRNLNATSKPLEVQRWTRLMNSEY